MKKVCLLAVLMVALTGCKKKLDYNEADLNKTKITLVSPGAEPTRVLRYKFRPDRTDALVMELKMSMDAGIPGLAVGEMDIPKIIMKAVIKSQGISDQGNLTYAMEVTGIDVEGAGKKIDPLDMTGLTAPAGGVDPDTLLTELQSMVGTSSTEEVTPRGFSVGSDSDSLIGDKLNKISSNTMIQPEENLWIPLPEEAVGKGAKWTASRLMRKNGILFSQQMTYELIDLQGDQGRVRISLVQDAPEQEFVSPDMPAGATAEFEKLESKGLGQMSFDLTRPVTTMQLEMKIAMQILVKAEGQRVRARPKVNMKVWFKPQKT